MEERRKEIRREGREEEGSGGDGRREGMVGGGMEAEKGKGEGGEGGKGR